MCPKIPEMGQVTCALFFVCSRQARSQAPPPPSPSSMDEERGPPAISPEPPDVGEPGPPAPTAESANGRPPTDSLPSTGKSRTPPNS